MAKEFFLNTEADTDELAARVSRALKPGDIVLLKGDLGAGKTRFVRGAAEFLGARNQAGSPTFTLLNVYSGSNVRICHIDMYRLNGEDDFIAAGLEDELEGAVSFIEWPERAWDYLAPKSALIIRLETAGENRKAVVTGRLEDEIEPFGD